MNILSNRKINKLKLTQSGFELVRTFFQILRKKRGSSAEDLASSASFERQFSKSFGSDLEAVIFPHARVGLLYILNHYSFPKDAEVVMTPLTIADMVNSIHLAGLTPKFVDIELQTLNFNISELEAAITPNTRAILITYIAGIVPDLEKIISIAKKYNLKIIEDCSQAVHAKSRSQLIGTIGDASIFSLTNFKIISSLFGGMILTRDMHLVEDLRHSYLDDMHEPNLQILSKHCFKNIVYLMLFNRFVFSYFSYLLILFLEFVAPELTYRLYSGNIKVILGENKNTLLAEFPPNYLCSYTKEQAILGLATLQRSKKVVSRRRENGILLLKSISKNSLLKLPVELPMAENAYWRFPLMTVHVDALKKYLLLRGIDSAKTFLTLCSEAPGFEKYHSDTPCAAEFKRNALILEVDEKLTHTDILNVASAINAFFVSIAGAAP